MLFAPFCGDVRFEILNFGYWDLFGICDLGFGIYKTHFEKTKLGLETDFSDEIEERK